MTDTDTRDKMPVLQLNDFIMNPEDVSPGGVFVKGRQTPDSDSIYIVGAPLDAQIEDAWLNEDDERAQELMEARARILGRLAL